MIVLPFGWTATSVPAATTSAADTEARQETLAENVARVQAEAVAKHAQTGACAWCSRGMSSAACSCGILCDASDCEAEGPRRGWKGPEFMREVYGVPIFE